MSNNEEAVEWKRRGDEYVKKEQFDEAIQCYQLAVYTDPDYVSAWNNLGYTLSKLGRFEEAKRVKEKITDINKKVEYNNLKTAREDKKTRNANINKHYIKIFGIIVIIVIVSLFILGSFLNPSTLEETPEQTESSISNAGTKISTRTSYDNSRTIRELQDILKNYHKTHTYIGTDVYVCGDMSSDVWNMVETKGINAVLQVGNVEEEITTLEEANHVWVLAEVNPNNWIAMETTGGYLVCNNPDICPVDNPLYYTGWTYNDPKELKELIEAFRHPCEDGYVLGQDNLCHPACGGPYYCTGDSICVNGKCMGCSEGYIFGEDLQCHKECPPPGSGRYCERGVCGSDGLCHYSYY